MRTLLSLRIALASAALTWTLAQGQNSAAQATGATAEPSRAAEKPAPKLAPASTESRANSQLVIKARVRGVLVDVVVTKGKEPVSGLKQEDFFVLEDGERQKILSFTDHGSEPRAPSWNQPLPQTLSENTFANLPSAEDQLPINVLLYDVLNTPVQDQALAHEAIVHFLRNKLVGDRFAIFVLGDKLRLLQGLTDDQTQLLEAIGGQGKPSVSSFAEQPATAIPGSDLLARGAMASRFISPSVIDNLKNVETLEANYLAEQRFAHTVDALRQISRFLSGVPGRKNLIWLAASFPLGMVVQGDPLNAFPAASPYLQELKDVTDELVMSQIAIYPVDSGGLITDPLFSAENPREYRTSADLLNAHWSFTFSLAVKQAAMETIAEDSGGHAFYNTNGLAEAMATAVREGANYYTLMYSPSNSNFDGGLRKIKVRLRETGLHLSYRRTYVASDPPVIAPADRLEQTMERGAPTSFGLLFGVKPTPQGMPVAPSAAQRAALAKFEPFTSPKALQGARLQHYSLYFTVPEFGRVAADSGEQTNGKLMILGFDLYDRENRLTWRQRNVIRLARSPRKTSEDTPYHFSTELDAPLRASWLRVAVQDVAAGRVGSIEIRLRATSDSSGAAKER